jgi:hypothetical protein
VEHGGAYSPNALHIGLMAGEIVSGLVRRLAVVSMESRGSSMKVSYDLPGWITWPLRLVFYSLALFILFNVVMGIAKGRLTDNTEACIKASSVTKAGLAHAKNMVACLREKNGILEDWLIHSTYRAIDAMPNAQKDFVGTWDASQPRCTYRHKLDANGEFTSESHGCSISSATFHGAWGVYENQMMWLPDGGNSWPPDINQIDVVDEDTFLLVELDGSRTKFLRTDKGLENGGQPYHELSSSELATNKGYEWARERDIRSHAQCSEQWTDENHEPYERSGCSKYVSEVKVLNNLPPLPKHDGWDDGTTTAECVAEVHAHWDPLFQDMLERGEGQLYAARQSDIADELRQCQNYDNVRIGRVIHQPQLRLNSILKRVKAGKPLTGRNKLTIRRDYPGVREFPEHEYRTRYLDTLKEVFAITGGQAEILSDSPIDEAEGLDLSEDETEGDDNGIIKAEKYLKQLSLSENATDPEVVRRNAKIKEYHERLDRLQAQGVGMVDRSTQKKTAVKEEKSPEARFVPMSREAFRESQTRAFEKIEERTKQSNKESTERLTGYINQMNDNCGGKLIDYPVVGMTDETFRNCTIHARFGGVIQIVADTYESVPLRLYVFNPGRVQKVYSVNGLVTAVKP